jgi:hypothetical protein
VADAPLVWVPMVNSLCFISGLVDGLSIIGDGLSVTHGRFRGTFRWFGT